MNLSQEDWTAKLNSTSDAVILDVRTPDEIAEGIIPNAIVNDIHTGQDFINKLESMDKSKSYFVYCKLGGRSEQACAIMNQMGFVETYNLVGGFTNWNGKVTIP